MTAPELPYYPITHDDGLNIVEALNDLIGTENSLSLIAEDFDETKSYDVGNYVRYSTLLYRFTTPHPAGVWNENHVTPIKVGEQLNAFNNEKINNNAVAPEFRNDVNYAVGDVVSYQGGLYRYLSPHTVGNWDRTEVVATNAISEGGGGGTGVGDEITFDGDNMIITSSERSIESLESSIAIVVNGDTHPAITSAGVYVYVKMHDTLPEGLYTTNSAIGENVALTTSNLTSVSGGGLNSVKSITENLFNQNYSVANLSIYLDRVTIESGGYVRIGKYVFVNMILKAKSTTQGLYVCITGFPESDMSFPLLCLECNTNPAVEGSIQVPCASRLGYLYIPITTGKYYFISGVYRTV